LIDKNVGGRLLLLYFYFCMSSQALVPGAVGFIGSHTCRDLAKAGHQVVGRDDVSGGFRDFVPAGVQEGVARMAALEKA
jgi:UDP-glucose 4-epimerase